MVQHTTKKTPIKTTAKASPKAKAPTKLASKPTEFQPNKVTFTVAALAVVTLVLLGLMATYS